MTWGYLRVMCKIQSTSIDGCLFTHPHLFICLLFTKGTCMRLAGVIWKKWWDHLSLSVKHLSSISPCLSSACLGSGWFGGSLAKSSFIHSLLFITHQLYGFFLVYCVHELFNSLESTQFSLHAWYTPSFFFLIAPHLASNPSSFR